MTHSTKLDDRLLATHIVKNQDFETACLAGDAIQIMAIVEEEMKKNNLFTKGAKKLQADIQRMLHGKTKLSYYAGQDILMFVWNSRMSGIGFAAK